MSNHLLGGLGLVWLFLEAFYGLNDVAPGDRIGFLGFLIIGVVLGLIWFVVDGLLIAGYLKQSIEIRSNAFDTTVKIIFDDLFSREGWKVISVNDFFDSTVDENHVSKNSLHGIMLIKYWPGNISDWDSQIMQELNDIQPENVPNRAPHGKPNRYPIGTTAKVSTNNNNFLCVALTSTNIDTLQASACSGDLNMAIRGMLDKARTTCSGDVLNIPLIGSGLARTGIKPNIIVDLILLAVFEESKRQKITNFIRIVLPKNMKKQIDLTTIQKDWK